MNRRLRRRWRERGVALVTALSLMLVVLMLGVSAARIALDAGKSARLERDRQLALQAAEGALADAERDIAGGAGPSSARAAAFAPGGAAFVHGCGRAGAALGLCRITLPAAVPVWQSADIEGDAAVPYGRFTGAVLPTGSALLPARPPRYIIERLALATDPAAGEFYRITAIGYGSHEAARVVLQSIYRKPPAAGSQAALPDKRISWREIGNWPELHQAAAKRTPDQGSER
ncbi:MAG: PilX N-terminal domain-containing pilus assembly protein [Massilia sp.]